MCRHAWNDIEREAMMSVETDMCSSDFFKKFCYIIFCFMTLLSHFSDQFFRMGLWTGGLHLYLPVYLKIFFDEGFRVSSGGHELTCERDYKDSNHDKFKLNWIKFRFKFV